MMVVDAALTSSGLSYFTVVVPKVILFSRKFVDRGVYSSLCGLTGLKIGEALLIFRNERCWRAAKDIAAALQCFGNDDREALRKWASQADPEKLKQDPVGSVKGVGLVTFQYLRMMGGVDTIMPDRVVKKIVNKFLAEAGFQPVEKDLEFMRTVTEIGREIKVRPVELCWMTWLLEGENDRLRSTKDSSLLLKI